MKGTNTIKTKTLVQYLKKRYPTKASREKADNSFSRLLLGYEIYAAKALSVLTQKELARRIATTQSEIARIESGEQNLTTDKLNKIADALRKKLEISLK